MPNSRLFNSLPLFLAILCGLLSGLSLFAAEPLRVDDAFPQEITVSKNAIALKISMRDDYYLYKHALKFASGDESIELGEIDYPETKTKYDEFVGETEIYDKDLELKIPFTKNRSNSNDIIFIYTFQGCLTDSICYPPTSRTVVLDLKGSPSFVGTPIPEEERNINKLIADTFDAAPDEYNLENSENPEIYSDSGTDNFLESFGTSNASDDDILPVDKAFQLTVDVNDDGYLVANWFAEDGYYLYQKELSFSTDNPAIALGTPLFPKAKIKNDEIFGETPVYFGMANIRVPIMQRPADATSFTLIANYQGCKEDSICYPPSVTQKSVNLAAGNAVALVTGTNDLANNSPQLAEHDDLASKILSGSVWLTILSFFAFGLALTFTPCVLPMVPILSGIITGTDDKEISTRKAFNLSVIYVLSMAVVFTLAGVATAMLGQNMQAAFQHPAIIIAFSLLFVLFALSMFGLFELQMPASVQNKLAQISNRQESGSYAGAAIMGVLSALIVGPCVTPPLSAALIVIADHGDVFRGGLSLFALALGMGVPLVIFGTSMGKVLPKAGGWMDHVKTFFGILMLGLAIWMLARIIPDSVTLILWALLALLTAVFAGALKPLASDSPVLPQIFKAVGWMALLYSAILFIGGITGAKDPLRPLSNFSVGGSIEHREIQFKRIKSVSDLERELEMASANNQRVFLDFYADWCIACKEMEKYTLNQPAVLDAFNDWVLLQADVTPNDELDKAFMQLLKVPGPPAMLFFDRSGQEVNAMRLYGFNKPQAFLQHMKRLP